MDHGFTEIQETLNSHLGVPYFSKAPSLNALSYTKSTYTFNIILWKMPNGASST
jgi:hypothetical protein